MKHPWGESFSEADSLTHKKAVLNTIIKPKRLYSSDDSNILNDLIGTVEASFSTIAVFRKKKKLAKSTNELGLSHWLISNFKCSDRQGLDSSGNAGLSGLSSTADGRQLTDNYLFGIDRKSGALSRTSGLSALQKQEIRNAYNSGKIKTRYTVVKDRHAGAGVTQGLTKKTELGVGGSSQINEIVIIELPLKK